MEPADEVDVIEEPERAQALLQPMRLELLERLESPQSAASLSLRLGMPRQRLNYHLRELEAQRLIAVAGERRKGSVLSRLYRRTAASYAISSGALGRLAARPEHVQDRASADYQIALASQAVRDIAMLRAGARAARQRLATFALAVEVRFADARSRHAFAEELAAAVADLVRRHHDERARGGRTFRFYLGAYPRPAANEGRGDSR